MLIKWSSLISFENWDFALIQLAFHFCLQLLQHFEFRAKYTLSKQQQSCVDQFFGNVYLHQNLRKISSCSFSVRLSGQPCTNNCKLKAYKIHFYQKKKFRKNMWKKKIIRNVRVSISSFKIPSGKTDRSSEQSRTKFSIFLKFRPKVSLVQKLSRSRFGAKIQSASKPSFILRSLWNLHHIQQSNVSFM